MEQKSNNSRRLRTVSLIVVITLAGKVLGLVRDMLLGHILFRVWPLNALGPIS